MVKDILLIHLILLIDVIVIKKLKHTKIEKEGDENYK